MAYRVGFQCFQTKEAATDYQMSLVVPIILSDGTIVYPKKVNDTWQYQGQVINLSFGECDPKQDFYDGLMIAGAFVSLFAFAFIIKFTIKFVWQAFVKEETIIVEKD